MVLRECRSSTNQKTSPKRPIFKNPANESPRKRRCPDTPATKLSSGMANFTISTPGKTSTSLPGLKSRSCSRTLKKNIMHSNTGDSNLEIEENDENLPPNGYDTELKSRLRSQSRCRDAPLTEKQANPNRITRSQSRSRQNTFEVEALRKHVQLSPKQLFDVLKETPVKPICLRLKKVGVDAMSYRLSESPFAKTPARILREDKSFNTEQSDSDSSESDSGSEESPSGDDTSDVDSISSNLHLSVPKSRSKNVQRKHPSKSNRVKTRAPIVTKKKARIAPRTLEDLRSCLHTSEVPERMPCREEEYAQVRRFIESAVSPRGTSQAMYISGVPGTGKTATTLHVIDDVREQSSNDFLSVYVNGMELLDPKLLFVKVYKAITDETRAISAQNARRKLNAMFEMSDRKRLPIVVLVDELDQLCTKRQEIIYDVFNWTVVESARVSVIAIANTLDLPERMLSQRITSRLGSNRIIFQPYEYKQIEDIIKDRLKGAENAVCENAVTYASRKVAAISGDLRKAMDILRRAIEIAVADNDTKLDMKHVDKANKEAASVPRVSMVVALSRHALALFRAAVSQVQSTGLEEFTFCDLYKQYCILCRTIESLEPVHEYGCHTMLMRMCSNRLLVASSGANMVRRKIRLAMTPQEAQFAIKQHEESVKSGMIAFK